MNPSSQCSDSNNDRARAVRVPAKHVGWFRAELLNRISLLWMSGNPVKTIVTLPNLSRPNVINHYGKIINTLFWTIIWVFKKKWNLGTLPRYIHKMVLKMFFSWKFSKFCLNLTKHNITKFETVSWPCQSVNWRLLWVHFYPKPLKCCQTQTYFTQFCQLSIQW